MAIYYKAVNTAESSIYKSWNKASFGSVQFSVGNVSSPHPTLLEKGYGLLVFDTLYNCKKFILKNGFFFPYPILEVEADETMPLPRMGWIDSDLIVKLAYGVPPWPKGTVMVPKLKTIRVLGLFTGMDLIEE